MTGLASRWTKPSRSKVCRVWASIFSLTPPTCRRSSLNRYERSQQRGEHQHAPAAGDVLEHRPGRAVGAVDVWARSPSDFAHGHLLQYLTSKWVLTTEACTHVALAVARNEHSTEQNTHEHRHHRRERAARSSRHRGPARRAACRRTRSPPSSATRRRPPTWPRGRPAAGRRLRPAGHVRRRVRGRRPGPADLRQRARPARSPQHAAVIDAAKAAGVAQLAYTGVFGGPNAYFALADDHRATEQLILDCGLPYTFLRNNWYSEDVRAATCRHRRPWRRRQRRRARRAASPPRPRRTSRRPPRSC